MRRPTTAHRVCAALLALVVIACGDESPVDVHPPEPTIDNIWPHEDQRSWTYTIEQYQDSTIADFPNCDPDYCFATPEEAPPAPSLAELAALLGDHPLPEDPVLLSGVYRIEFDSLLTTESGRTGQNLVETLLADSVQGQQSIHGRSAFRFLSVLAAARPDLRAEIQKVAPGIDPLASVGSIDPPLFLAAHAWVKTATEIGSYSDLDTLLGWKYLESDLNVGHEFVWQLVRQLASDVFLHVGVIAKGTRATPVGNFSNAIDILYMVDFGVGSFILGSYEYYRMISYGTITYAPEIGPIASQEINLVLVGTSGGLQPGFSHTTLELVGTGLPAPLTMRVDGRRMQ